MLATIGAGSVFNQFAESDEPLTDEEVGQILNGTAHISVTGKIEYSDGFGKEEWKTFFMDYILGAGWIVRDGPWEGGRMSPEPLLIF